MKTENEQILETYEAIESLSKRLQYDWTETIEIMNSLKTINEKIIKNNKKQKT